VTKDNLELMEWKINVGTVLKLKHGFLKGTSLIMYCGMPNENTFVLAPFIVKGYQGFSPNIYYNSNSRIIQIHKRQFEVYEVTTDYIILGDLDQPMRNDMSQSDYL